MWQRFCKKASPWVVGVALLGVGWSHALALNLPADYVYENEVFSPEVKTVQFYRGDNVFSFPELLINQADTLLTLTFDILSEVQEDLVVNFVHCNLDWRRSELLPMEYYDGLQDARINDITNSRVTLQPYMHYRIQCPPNGAVFRASGNYALVVTRIGEPAVPVLVRRFVVLQKRLVVSTDLGLSTQVSGRWRLQQLNFSVSRNPQLDIFDPDRQLTSVVLQNQRWDNARALTSPTYQHPDRFEYVFQAANEFEGGNEFRLLDLRSTRGRISPRVSALERMEDGTGMILVPESPRTANQYFSRPDLNGLYAVAVHEFGEDDLEADYLRVRFQLRMPEPIADGEVYVFGALSDWDTDPAFKLRYNPQQSLYQGTVLLKQGVYDYMYVVRREDGTLDEAALEGSHAETENSYSILVYFRGMNDRYDRLLGRRHFNFYDTVR